MNSGGVPLLPSRDAVRAVPWWAVPAYAAMVLLTHVFRASRWRHLIAPVKVISLKETILLNWIGFFAIFALPLRLGELARPALTKARQDVPISAGVGTVAVERITDGIITSLCVAWALFFMPRRESNDPVAQVLPLYGLLALGMFVGATVALGLFLWKRKTAVALVQRSFGTVSPKLGAFVADKVSSLADGVRAASEPRLASRFLLESLAYWGLNALGMWGFAVACGLDMSFGQAVALMGVLAIGILLPAGPGLFGNFQLALSTGLKLYFAQEIVAEQGAAYIFFLYAVQSVVLLLTGIIPLYVLRIPFSALWSMPADKPSG